MRFAFWVLYEIEWARDECECACERVSWVHSRLQKRKVHLPLSVSRELVAMNGLASPTRTMPPGVPPPPTTGSEDGIRLIAATSTDGTLPPNSEAWSVVGESSPTILLADTDVTDLMGSSYLMSVENARQLVSTEPPKPPPTLSEDLPEEEAEGELTDQDSPPLYASSMNTTDSMGAPRVRVLPYEAAVQVARNAPAPGQPQKHGPLRWSNRLVIF